MSSYKLYYFDAPGLGEPIRLILAYAKVTFEEVRFSRGPDWLKLKPNMPWNVVPVLEVDGQKLSQSLTIVRFLGSKFNLTPQNEWEAAKCDEYVNCIVDLRTEGKKFQREQDFGKKEELKNLFVTDRYPNFMTKLSKILQESGTGYVVGNKLSYADIFIAYTVKQIYGWIDCPSNALDNYPEVQTHLAMVMNLPGIKEWVASHP